MTHDEWVKAAIELRDLQIDNLTTELEDSQSEVERLLLKVAALEAEKGPLDGTETSAILRCGCAPRAPAPVPQQLLRAPRAARRRPRRVT